MNNERSLLLIGGGGHCKSILDCVLSSELYSKVGIIDKDKSISTLGISVVGDDNDLLELKKHGWTDAFISVGSVGSTILRRKLYRLIKDIGFRIPIICDKTSMIGCDVLIGEGSFIGKHAIINSGTILGACTIVNTGVIVEHDCKIGSFSHISPGAVLCGQVVVGDDSHIGAASVVRQGISVGNNVMIGIGSVVTKDINTDEVKAYGNPCRVVE